VRPAEITSSAGSLIATVAITHDLSVQGRSDYQLVQAARAGDDSTVAGNAPTACSAR
jgi:hypothetical protein